MALLFVGNYVQLRLGATVRWLPTVFYGSPTSDVQLESADQTVLYLLAAYNLIVTSDVWCSTQPLLRYSER